MSNKIVGNTNMLQVRSTKPLKIKDKIGRNRIVFNMKEFFGFLPEVLIVDKVLGVNNQIRLHAVLTDEEIRKEREGVDASEAKTPERSKKNRGVPSKK